MDAKTNNIMARVVFENMKKGQLPNFGSPETKCDKCMFCGGVCNPAPGVVGCLGGWKRDK